MGSREAQEMDSILQGDRTHRAWSLWLSHSYRAKGNWALVTASLISLLVRSTKGSAEGLPLLNILLCRGIAREQETIGMILALIHDTRRLQAAEITL